MYNNFGKLEIVVIKVICLWLIENVNKFRERTQLKKISEVKERNIALTFKRGWLQGLVFEQERSTRSICKISQSKKAPQSGS